MEDGPRSLIGQHHDTPCPRSVSVLATNTVCNAYFDYSRSDRIRTSTPTERVSLHSSYFQRLELTASYAYSSADMNAPLDELFNGLIQRSSIRQSTVTGPGQATRISNVADFTATLHISEHFRFVDTFRFWAYRIPQQFNLSETDWTCTDTATCSLLTPLSQTTQTLTDTPDQFIDVSSPIESSGSNNSARAGCGKEGRVVVV
jgi:hypothetical protein